MKVWDPNDVKARRINNNNEKRGKHDFEAITIGSIELAQCLTQFLPFGYTSI